MFKNLLTLLKKIKYELTFILKSSSEKNRYEDLKNLACQPLSEDILQTLEDVKKEQEFQSDWFKKK